MPNSTQSTSFCCSSAQTFSLLLHIATMLRLRRAMERHECGQCRVIAVILRPCDWQTTPFAKLLVTPKDGKPVTKWPDRDEAFLDVVKQIRAALPRHRCLLARHPSQITGCGPRRFLGLAISGCAKNSRRRIGIAFLMTPSNSSRASLKVRSLSFRNGTWVSKSVSNASTPKLSVP